MRKPTTTTPGRTSLGKIIQISAMRNGCFALTADGQVHICVYDGLLDAWLWHETSFTPGVLKR